MVNSEEAGMGSHLAVLKEGFRLLQQSALYFQNLKTFVPFDPVISLQETEPKKPAPVTNAGIARESEQAPMGERKLTSRSWANTPARGVVQKHREKLSTKH